MEIIKSPITIIGNYNGICDLCKEPLYFERLVVSLIEIDENGVYQYRILGMSNGDHYYEHAEVKCNGCGKILGITNVVLVPEEEKNERTETEDVEGETYSLRDRWRNIVSHSRGS